MSTFMYGIIFAIALLLFCWMLLEYRLRNYKHQTQDGNRLLFGTRTAFALTHFWKAVNDVKELPQETLIEDITDTPTAYQQKNAKPAHTHQTLHPTDRKDFKDSKLYRR